jgi:tetratricopeptide (TPR) repeat protein
MSAPTQTFQNALTAHQRGDVQTAEQLYRDILKRAPRHAGALTQLGFIAQGTERLVEARELLEKAARIEPNNPSVRNGLGQLYLTQRESAAAEVEFRAALDADPNYAPAWHNLGIIQAAGRRYDDAITSFQRALVDQPDDAQLLYNLGQAFGETGNFDGAVDVLGKAIRLQPAVPQVRAALGDVLLHAGDPEKALHHYREVERLIPSNPVGAHRIGVASQQVGDMGQAISAFERARALGENDPSLLCELANAHALAGATSKAQALFTEAAQASDGNPAALATAARGISACGDTGTARALLEPLIAARNGAPEVAILAAEVARDDDARSTARDMLLGALEQSDLALAQRKDALFALAGIDHRLGDYRAAIDHANEANRLKHARFDSVAESAAVDKVIETEISRADTNLADGPRLVFVVGMQRSGLRMIESLLSAHPDVRSVGPAGVLQATVNGIGDGAFGYLDLPAGDEKLAKAAQAHMDTVRDRIGDADVAVEAVPGNIFHLGLVKRLFPEAKIVICQRDSSDTALSCYFQDFAGASPYAYDLVDIAKHIENVARLDQYWRNSWGSDLLEVRFEDILDRTDLAVRSLLEYLDLKAAGDITKSVQLGRSAWRDCHTKYADIASMLGK